MLVQLQGVSKSFGARDILDDVSFQINAGETCSRRDSTELMRTHYPETSVRQPLPGRATLVSHDKATRLLGYQPVYSWRNSEFAEWLRNPVES